MKAMAKLLLAAAMVAAAPLWAENPAVEVSDVKARQRWPWNGLVDITCTVSGIDGTDYGLDFAVAAVMPDSSVHNATNFWVAKDGKKSFVWCVPTNGNYRLIWDAGADLGPELYSNVVVRVTVVSGHARAQLWEGGPYWAMTNVGAEKPSDYGWFFAWGSTRGYVYDWKIRHWASVDGTDPRAGFDQSHATSFGKDSENLRNEGLTTADDVLSPEHDAARANWGGPWRMPTKQEMEDLRDKCDWTWTTNGVKGFVVRGRDDYADAAIFLPATGFGIEEKWWARDSGGYLWSSGPYLEGPNADCSWRLHFTSRGIGTDYCWDRHIGTPARPVRD